MSSSIASSDSSSVSTDEPTKHKWNEAVSQLLKRHGVTVLQELGYGSFSVVYEGIWEVKASDQPTDNKNGHDDPVLPPSTTNNGNNKEASRTDVKKVPTTGPNNTDGLKKSPTIEPARRRSPSLSPTRKVPSESKEMSSVPKSA